MGINSLKKVKVVIRKIEEAVNKPYSTLYILLYIICLHEKELGYEFEDLFNKDGGIPGMYRVSVKKDNIHVLFNKYYGLKPNK